MKKILLLFIILALGTQICLAQTNDEEDINQYFTDDTEQTQQDTQPTQQINGYVEYNQQQTDEEKSSVYLGPVDMKKINFSSPKKLESKSLISGVKTPSFEPIQQKLQAASNYSTQEYNIKPVTTSYSKKYGKFSLGTIYDTSLDSASTNYTSTVFSKYDWKHFALTTAFSKDTNIQSNSFDDTIFIVPELKLTKNLSFLDIAQTDVNQINKKNELVLRYTPHFTKHADDVQFEIGAGQSFNQDTFVSSKLRFSTKFKL